MSSVMAYSFAEKKKVEIMKPITKKYALPNGNTVTITTGKSANGDKVSTIISNEKNTVDKKMLEYVKKVFEKTSIKYKGCKAIEEYKEQLKNKCIKFLGYFSETKSNDKCVAMRFRRFLEEHEELKRSLEGLGCKI
jgi:hypothetical protein